MSRFAFRIAGDEVQCLTATEDVAADPDSFCWIHLDPSDPSDRQWLERHAMVADHVIEALCAMETRPRVELYGQGAIINLRGPVHNPDMAPDSLGSVRLWLEQGRAISSSLRQMPALDALRHAVEAGQVGDPGDLVAHLAGSITESLDPEVSALGDEVDDCEEMVDAASVYAMRRKIARIRAEAIGLRRFLTPQRHALERLATLESKWIRPDDRPALIAAADRAARMSEELEAIRERAALMHEELTDLRAEQTDNRALLIAVVALVFLPLTFLTGLLGMNVEGIPYADRPWAFWGVFLVCVGIAIGVTLYFLRARWFR